MDSKNRSLTRREFLSSASALGAASLLGLPRVASAEPPPEVNKVRLYKAPITCLAPQFLAEQFLRMDGFSEVEYVASTDRTETGPIAVAHGRVDFCMWDALHMIQLIDKEKPLVVLSGLHVGCWELIANDYVKHLRDLKGKTVAIWGFEQGDHTLLSSMLAYVGMDPRKDINWLPGLTYDAPMQFFLEGHADAFMSFAPQPQLMRAEGFKGRVLINTAQDRPWSQYFCCSLSSNWEFVRANPIATKKVIRAFLKATDMCSREPETAARYMAERDYAPSYNIALEVLSELPYRRWRDANPEDTLRFHALRLHEVGMIKTAPNELIARGTDWRFLNELKRELKA